MEQLLPGTIQTMGVVRVIDTGYVLKHEKTEVLLHENETKHPLEENQEVDIFIYHDKQMNLIATTTLPNVVIDTYGWGEVKEVIPNLGAFVNIGTTKEMLVSMDDLPFYEKVWPKEGDQLYVTLGKDRKGKLLALPATEGIIEEDRELAPNELLNTEIKGHVYFTSREGTAIFTDEKYRGFVHQTERKVEPRLGEYVEGRVIEVKEDGTLNISLLPLKQDSMGEDADLILSALNEQDGIIPFSDKSDAEDIRGTFNISKSAFKRALGRLMKQELIEQKDGQTILISK